MTKTVVVTIATTPQQFPAGTVAAGIRVSLEAAGVTIAPAVVSSAPYNATFADVAPGDYTVTAQAIDAAGNPLGAPVTGSVSIPADAAPAVIDIPASLSIQVS